MRKVIESFPRYEVSTRGYVRNRYTGRILSPGDAKGYKFVVLTNGIKGHAIYVHKLVANAFLGPCPPGKEIDHKDDNKSNNRFDNLQYLTHLDNVRKGRAKLTLNDAFDIRWCRKHDLVPVFMLSDIYKVDVCTINDIEAGRTWKV